MPGNLEPILSKHPFFADLSPEVLSLVVSCARNRRVEPGQMLARTGEPADEFFLIRDGLIAVETHLPGRGAVTLQTVHAGDVAGWSWLFPPYLWTFDLRAVEPSLVLAMGGKCLREKCEKDPALGYLLMKRLSRIMTERLRATRLQLLDVYHSPSTSETGGSRGLPERRP